MQVFTSLYSILVLTYTVMYTLQVWNIYCSFCINPLRNGIETWISFLVYSVCLCSLIWYSEIWKIQVKSFMPYSGHVSLTSDQLHGDRSYCHKTNNKLLCALIGLMHVDIGRTNDKMVIILVYGRREWVLQPKILPCNFRLRLFVTSLQDIEPLTDPASDYLPLAIPLHLQAQTKQ